MENDGDESPEERISYRDSDQFDEDSMSLCSWVSENDIVGGLTWRGWRKNTHSSSFRENTNQDGQVTQLLDLCAKVVAKHFPFEAVEEYKPPIPEQIQLKILYWSFPQCEDDIQLYSCLAHGTMDEFQKAELIMKLKNVKDVFQIGFHLSGVVTHNSFKSDVYNVAVTFDRCQIISCSCSCRPNATWCSHITALCIYRIRHPNQVCFRAPVSESLSRLHRDQLQKFAQYLINELPPQVLPTAQRLLDDLLTSPLSKMNSVHGAPDPTAGACFSDKPKWCLDSEALHENIRKILCRFCGPSPVAFVDMNSIFFSTSTPMTSIEWSNFLRPLISREPEGIWNLLEIVRDLLKTSDSNSTEILQIISEEFLNFHQLAFWWFISATEEGNDGINERSLSYNTQNHSNANLSTTEFAKNAGARLLDECVTLWRVSLMKLELSEDERKQVKDKLEIWQKIVIEKARKGFNGDNVKFDKALQQFKGFEPAIEAAKRDWKQVLSSYEINLESQMLTPELTDFSSVLNQLNTAPGSVHVQKTADTMLDIEDLFSCVEAYYILGLSKVAMTLALLLAQKLLSLSTGTNDQQIERNYATWRPLGQLSTITESDHISVAIKSAFICKVLRDVDDHHHLAFELALFGIGLPRRPASTKSQEVKLAHCEMSLRSALKLMTIGPKELEVIRSYANSITVSCTSDEPQSLPLVLTIYVFEILSQAHVQSNILTRLQNKFSADCAPTHEDEKLGYQAAMSSLRWKSKAEGTRHSMLCESIRRMRCDLALTLLWHCREDKERIREILSVLLKFDIREETIVAEEKFQSRFELGPHGTRESDCNVKNGAIPRSINAKTFMKTATSSRQGPNRWTSEESSDERNDCKFSDSSRKFGRNKKFSKKSQQPVAAPAEERSFSEDWDEEISRDGKPGMSGSINASVDGVLQVKLSITNQKYFDRKDELSSDSANCSSDSIPSGLNRISFVMDSSNDEEGNNQVLLNHATLDGAVRKKEDDVAANSETFGVRQPEVYGNVVVSGLSETDRNRKSLSHQKPVQSEQEEKLSSEDDLVWNNIDHELAEAKANENEVKNRNMIGCEKHLMAKMTSSEKSSQSDNDNHQINPKIEGENKSERKQEKSDISKSCDGTNTWDPALSWAESCDEKDIQQGYEMEGKELLTKRMKSIKITQYSTREIDNHSIECDAHALFELAKNVLSKAVGQTIFNYDVAADEDSQSRPYRSLQLAAFEIALFSLNLQNQISPKWLSRTYSSHVSWIADKAVDIGHTALQLLNEQWESVLTPSEVIDISSRAVRSGDQLLRRTAAELALSCLPQAHTLNPGEIQLSLSMCKEHDTNMLARACSAIETASRNGGIQPQILFDIGRQWQFIHDKSSQSVISDTQSTYIQKHHERNENSSQGNPPIRNSSEVCELNISNQGKYFPVNYPPSNLIHSRPFLQTGALSSVQLPPNQFSSASLFSQSNGAAEYNASFKPRKENSRNLPLDSMQFNKVSSQPNLPHHAAAREQSRQTMGLPQSAILTAEQYVQQQMHQMAEEMLSRNISQATPTAPAKLPADVASFSWIYPQYLGSLHHCPMPQHVLKGKIMPTNFDAMGMPISSCPSDFDTCEIPQELRNAFRVGMKALEGLANRGVEERAEVKFAPSPPCSDDIRWLCALSASLGPNYLRKFCSMVIASVSSPYVLHDLALEAARHFALYNPAQLASHLRSPAVSPIVMKCLAMYSELVRRDLVLLSQIGYADFVELLRRARSAFCMAPGGMTKFNELLEMIRKSCPKKRDLWQHIMNGLSRA